jgi:Ca2+-binding RTX toxin-like protein
VLNGFAGDDRLVSGAGLDNLQGGDGNDVLTISDKTLVRDVIAGGSGKDVLKVSDGQDLSLASISGMEVLQVSGTVTLTVDQVASFSEISGGTVQLAGSASTFALQRQALVWWAPRGTMSSRAMPEMTRFTADGAVIFCLAARGMTRWLGQAVQTL